MKSYTVRNSGSTFFCRPLVALALGAVFVIGSSVRAQPGGGDGPPPAPVRVDHVAARSLQDRFAVVGELRAVRRSVVAAEVSGRLIEVPAEAGDTVEADAVLARIDPVWAKLDLADAEATRKLAEAEVAEMEAELEDSRIDLSYLEELAEAGSAKPREVRQGRTAVEADRARLAAAEARVAAAMADIDRAKTQMAKLTVTAPFAAAVIERRHEPGEWVESGDPVVELVSLGEIDAWIDVPQRLVNRVEPGEDISLRIDATGEHVTTAVNAVVAAADARSRTFAVRARMSDRDRRFKPGMSVTALVPVGRSVERLTVSADAVLQDPTGGVVWTVVAGKAEPVAVEVLFREGDRLAVQPVGDRGLADGDPVVIEGAERLRPGQAVRISAEGRGHLEGKGESKETPVLER